MPVNYFAAHALFRRNCAVFACDCIFSPYLGIVCFFFFINLLQVTQYRKSGTIVTTGCYERNTFGVLRILEFFLVVTCVSVVISDRLDSILALFGSWEMDPNPYVLVFILSLILNVLEAK